MATQQDIIKAFMKSIDETNNPLGNVATDTAFKTASNGKYTSMQKVIDAFLSDLSSIGNANKFLREKCGIILDNEDNGSITGWDAGGKKVKTDINIIPENTPLVDLSEKYKKDTVQGTYLPDDVTLSGGTLSFNRRGLTVNVPDYDTIIAASSNDTLAQKKLTVINGLYSWWIEEAIKLNEESYGENFGFTEKSSASVKKMNIILKDDESNDNVAETNNNFSNLTSLNLLPLQLTINMRYFKNISFNNINEKINEDYLDATLAHEFTHAVMDANIRFYLHSGIFYIKDDLPVIINEGLADLTRGIDVYRKSSIISVLESHIKDSNNSDLASVLNYDIVYKNTVDLKRYQYAAGYMLLRYFAKQCATEDNLPTTSLGANATTTGSSEDGELFKANNGIAAILKGVELPTA